MSGFSFLKLVERRFSLRRYDVDRRLSDHDLLFIFEAARLAPSAENSQPWRFVIVRDPAVRARLARECFSGMYLPTRFAGEAPAIVALCANRARIIKRAGEAHSSNRALPARLRDRRGTPGTGRGGAGNRQLLDRLVQQEEGEKGPRVAPLYRSCCAHRSGVSEGRDPGEAEDPPAAFLNRFVGQVGRAVSPGGGSGRREEVTDRPAAGVHSGFGIGRVDDPAAVGVEVVEMPSRQDAESNAEEAGLDLL